MILEALKYVVELRKPHELQVDERLYVDKPINPVLPPEPEPIDCSTLTGFVDAVRFQLDQYDAENSFIHLITHDEVQLVAAVPDTWARRLVHIKAELGPFAGFCFGNWQEPEHFIIGLQSMFEPSPDLARLLSLCASLTSESLSTAHDDGVTQTAIIKKGAALKETTRVNPRVALAPFRTFREVDQPVSDFLFRLRGRDNQPPMCCLFEADGGKWKIDAAAAVKTYLAKELPAYKIVQ